jgi:hypothetical protein
VAGASAAALPRIPSPLAKSATVGADPALAAARPAALTVTLGYEMQCGYPGAGPVRITLPAAIGLPAHLTRKEVLVDGREAQSAALAGGTVTVGLAAPPRVMCDVIGPGRLTVEILPSASLVNPARAGSYPVAISVGQAAFTATLVIQPA